MMITIFYMKWIWWSDREFVNRERYIMDLQQLKENFSVKEYLDDRGIDYRTEGDNVSLGWVNIDCPFCGEDNKHCGIHYEQGNYFHCWVCNETGDVIKLIMEIESASFSVVKRRLEEYQDGEYFKQRPKKQRRYTRVLPEEFLPIQKNNEPLLVRRYFERRGFALSLCQEYGLGWCDQGEYPLRLIVPVHFCGMLVSFQAVDLTGQARVKYIDCPEDRAEMPNKHCLYGIDDIGDQIILVEGVTDKWRIGRDGVALFTKNWTHKQIELLYSVAKGRRVKVLLDLDAVRDGERLSSMLKANFSDVMFIELEEGDPEDPAEFDQELVRKVLEA